MSCDSQLLILGNGFDLQCGLKSSFKDFMKTRQAVFFKTRGMVASSPIPPDTGYMDAAHNQKVKGNSPVYWYRYKGLTIWDFILYEDQQQRAWYDVEECIRKWVDCRLNPSNPQYVPPIQQVHSDYLKYRQSHQHQDFWKQWERRYNPEISKETENVILTYAQDFYLCDEGIGGLFHEFMDELHQYEQAFATYLKEQQTQNKDYFSSATNLLLNLVNDQMSSPVLRANPLRWTYTSHPESIGILNFNYTDPLNTNWGGKPDALNIHGLASQGDIIFGIDGANLSEVQNHYADTVKFTKTYRLMAFSSHSHRSLVRPYLPNSTEGATDMIKFFGHSLGDADYSYFQAIFDEVNLYESNTHLIFYYNANRSNDKEKGAAEKTKDKAQQEMFEKVNRLITTYGRTLDNEDHGKNLLHKLLLEGRLTIKQAPIDFNPAYWEYD
ncbi:AbiH family protein [Bifidobacterium apis]|uniref:AbiH family protein n=1 Tax=Bifidobacterium apis TaxID=3081440 RepID=UPI0030D73887